MKKIIISIALVAAAATTSMAQMSVGAGYLNSSSTTSVTVGEKTTTTTGASDGFYVGGDMKFDVRGGLAVVPGLYYGMLSSSGEGIDLGSLAKGNSKTTSHYLSIPVHVQYGLNLIDGLGAFVYAGPQFNLGLASTTVVTAEVLGSTTTTKIDNYEDSDLERFDIALGAGIGFDIMDIVRVKVGYNWGLLDLHDEENVKMNTNNFHVGVALLF